MTEDDRKRLVRRIADYLHKYATQAQLEEIAMLIKLPPERKRNEPE